jgi:predicted O-methyltransferase YrrM
MDREPSPKPRYDLIKSFVDDEVFVIPRWLPQKYLANCILVSDRTELLKRLPRQGVVAEIGTQRGDFAKEILENCEPREFHVFDLSFRDFDRAFFDAAISRHQVILHEGDSSTEMAKLPDALFDWIYIDGDHTFEGVVRDVREAKRLIKPNGFLVFNDYTNYSPLERMQYGVMRAVNDLCLDDDFEIAIFALSALGYHDVALRRRSLPPGSGPEVSDKPWNSSPVPNEIYETKGMLGDEERRALFWLAENYYAKKGCIVDAGAYAGASAFCLASGLAKRADLSLEEPVIYSYDFFEAKDGYVASQLAKDFGQGEIGDGYLDKFELQTKKHRHIIHAISGDFLQQRWNGKPIEFLFVDMAKTKDLNAHVVREFFPHLIPGHSLVIQQDFYFCWHPYIHITMEFFKDYFEVIDRRLDQSRLYFYKKKIPDDEIDRIARNQLSQTEEFAYLDRYVASETGDDRAMAQVAHFCRLVQDQSWSAAKEAYQAIVDCYRPDNHGKSWRMQAERIATQLIGK